MRITLPLTYQKSIVSMPSGKRFDLPSLRKAVKMFKATCPRKGGMFNRKHIQLCNKYTHDIVDLHLNEDGLCAEVMFFDKVMEDGNYQIKPIISMPFEDADPAVVLEIRQIQLESQ